MAEENAGISVAVDINEAEGSQEESSDVPGIVVTETNEPEVSSITDESVEIPVSVQIDDAEGNNVKVTQLINAPKCRPKILSRYLSPSPGSCHDLCKYGMKQSFEGNRRSPGLRRVKSVGSDGGVLKRAISSLKQNKHASSLKSSTDCNIQIFISDSDLKGDVVSSSKIVSITPKRSLPAIKELKAAAVSCIGSQVTSPQSKKSSFSSQRISITKRDKEVKKGKEHDGGPSSCSNSSSKSLEIDTSTEDDKKALVAPKVHIKRFANADRNSTGRSRLSNQSHPIRIKSIQSNNEDVREEILYVIEPSIKNETQGSAQDGVHMTDFSQPESTSAIDNGQEVDQTPQFPQLSVKKNARRARNGVRSKILLPSSSLSWGFKGLRHTKLGIVRTQPSLSLQSPFMSSSEPKHSKHGSPTSGHDVKKVESSKVEHKINPRRKGITDSGNGNGQSRRLKFRKGRVIDLQPENNVPRRLKFRRVRLLGENQNFKSDSKKSNIHGKDVNQDGDEANETENKALTQQDQECKRKKSFRRREFVDGKSAANRIKPERVSLRHQDSKGKKEMQNLFNNVIEETASKLAKTRKSKVKALVGAFETVISLQDSRPSATISA